MSPPVKELILPLRKVSVADALASDIPTEGSLQNRFQAALPSIARRRIGSNPCAADSPAGADEQKAFQPKLSRTSGLLLSPSSGGRQPRVGGGVVVAQPPQLQPQPLPSPPANPAQEEAVAPERPAEADAGLQPGLQRQLAASLLERGGDAAAPLEERQPGLFRASTKHSRSDPWWPRNFQHYSRDSDDQIHESEEEPDPWPEPQPCLSRASLGALRASGWGSGPEAGAGPGPRAFDAPATPDEPESSPTRSSGSRPPRTGSGYLRRPPASGLQGSVLARLRESFATGMGAGSSRVCRTQLFCHVKSLAEARCGLLSVDLLELLCEVIKRSYAEVALGLEDTKQGGFGVDEWVHNLMLRSSAPGHTAAVGLNRRLSRAMREDPGLLRRLHAAFEAAEAGGGDGRLSFDRAKAALRSVGAKELVAPVDPDEQSDMDYYHFVSHALGAEACEVELALYDLSQGAARWVPPALLGGHRFDGIWHSGVRVFGKEFWYGGVILESRFEENPFGKPAQVISLGKTLRTREEVLEFLRNDLYADFNPRTYDVLRRNCNHFSNELVQLLLHGKQIPEEVRMQPEWARNARLVRALRPLLNRWLGGFGSDDFAGAMSPSGSPASPACPPHVVSRIDDLTEEWRSRLQEGDIVLHRARFIDRPSVVRILRFGAPANGSGPRLATIALFRPAASRRDDGCCVAELAALWDWEVAEQAGVPLRELYPLLSQGEAGAQILRAGFTLTDARLGDILQRPPSTCVRPVCARGHRLQPEVASWFRQAPLCTVCAAKLAASDQRMCCARCSFLVCTACVDRGLSMPGGGVFADMLSRELAEALLADKGWLAFRARAYFYKADHNGTGSVDRAKARRLSSRLGAELGIQQGAETDLVRQIWWQGSGSEAVELDEEAFVSFFGGALSRALARPPPTPQQAHCGGAAVLPTALVARQCKDTAAAL